jgi:hypothetical protein
MKLICDPAGTGLYLLYSHAGVPEMGKWPFMLFDLAPTTQHISGERYQIPGQDSLRTTAISVK